MRPNPGIIKKLQQLVTATGNSAVQPTIRSFRLCPHTLLFPSCVWCSKKSFGTTIQTVLKNSSRRGQAPWLCKTEGECQMPQNMIDRVQAHGSCHLKCNHSGPALFNPVCSQSRSQTHAVVRISWNPQKCQNPTHGSCCRFNDTVLLFRKAFVCGQHCISCSQETGLTA